MSPNRGGRTTEDKLCMKRRRDSYELIGPTKVDENGFERKLVIDQDVGLKMKKTFLINIAFLVLGVCESVRGPTLLDLEDIYDTSLETISLSFIPECLGSLLGSFLTGYMMNKYPHYQEMILFWEIAFLGISITLTPFGGSIVVFFFLFFFVGLLVASVHTGGNVLCLDIWAGSDCGPHVHSIHFMFSCGCFLAPIISEPFLSPEEDEQGGSANRAGNSFRMMRRFRTSFRPHNQLTSRQNVNALNDGDNPVPRFQRLNFDSGIEVLYPLIGLGTFLVSLGFLYFGLKSMAAHRRRTEIDAANNKNTPLFLKKEAEKLKAEQEAQPEFTPKVKFLVAVFSAFLFLYVGIEYCVGMYLATFAVESDLKATRLQGADLTALFWGAFAMMRFFAIFASMRVKPIYTLSFSFVVCVVGSTAMMIFGESSLAAMQITTVIVGFGMGTVFATGLSWMEGILDINNSIGATLAVAGSVGPDVFPALVGQVLDTWPMLLIYLQFGTILTCVGLFFVAYVAARRLL